MPAPSLRNYPDPPCRSIAVRHAARCLLAGMLVALSACHTAPVRPAAPAPELRLIDAQPLVLAEDCEASGSFYVEFDVLQDGRTSAIKAPAGPQCVQRALTDWVRSFRYAPRPSGGQGAGAATAATTAIEWMLVAARKGT